MSEAIIHKLIAGEAIDSEDFCDFSLQDQNELVLAKGASPSSPSEFLPTVGKNVCYIVAALIMNENKEILMIQEAKSSCAGQWYIPAGRMERGESITSAVKREVLEETGLEFDPTTLLMVETASGTWFRFILTGHVVGGRIKTPADADSESLQAQWVSDISSLDLRARDIHQLVTVVQNYHKQSDQWHCPVLPITSHYDKLLMRMIVFARRRSNNKVNILMSEKTSLHIPVCELCPTRSLHSTLKKFMTEIFGTDLPSHRPAGVLAVEYMPIAGQSDGLCITILVPVRASIEEVHFIDKYQWTEVDSSLGEQLITMIGKNMLVSLNPIR